MVYVVRYRSTGYPGGNLFYAYSERDLRQWQQKVMLVMGFEPIGDVERMPACEAHAIWEKIHAGEY